ncbi:butyrophilin subfamily 3 member A1-like [Alosa alosa]|uniref:butyrophilin subfamily 3 member A1-like n=1 Tax=Alosa alosa TaxID=278164 RepID=UPI0020151381|nr:butyrophilin subfamily 3 member A1-like [Alosa alosa]
MENVFVITLPLFCLMATTSASLHVLGPVHPIIVVTGEELLLPCYLSPNISAENMTVTWLLNHTGALVHLYTNGSDRNDQQHADYRGRTALLKEELSSGNTSLKLTNVTVSDEANYTCSIQDGHWHEEISLQIKVNEITEVEKVRKYGVNVTLDPATAHPQLILSVDRKQVTCGDAPGSVDPSTERFTTDLCVLGREGFTSGMHYYEVLVWRKRDWTVGLVWEHVNRNSPLKDHICDLYLALELRDGTCYSSESSDAIVQLREDIQKIGVFVDYDEGIVSFYDVGDDYIDHLYSFSQYCFAGKTLYPVFSPGASGLKSAPLIVLPVWDIEFKPMPENV